MDREKNCFKILNLVEKGCDYHEESTINHAAVSNALHWHGIC